MEIEYYRLKESSEIEHGEQGSVSRVWHGSVRSKEYKMPDGNLLSHKPIIRNKVSGGGGIT